MAAAEQFQASQLEGQTTFNTQAKADQQEVSAWSAAFEKAGRQIPGGEEWGVVRCCPLWLEGQPGRGALAEPA